MLQLEQVKCGFGPHFDNPEPTGNRDMCLMEAVAFFAREPWSDAPQCASPMIGAIVRSWNDGLPDQERDRILPAKDWVPLLINSRIGNAVEGRRAYMALDWLVRVCAPIWFELDPAAVEYAVRLRALEEIIDLRTADAARAITQMAAAHVRALNTAARRSTEDDIWDAAWTNSLHANEAYARSGVEESILTMLKDFYVIDSILSNLEATAMVARVASSRGVDLHPTIKALQESLTDLLRRLAVCRGL